MGGDILIIEEAAFISPDVFKNAILPMLGVNHTACLAISTPSDDDANLYTRMFQMKDEKGNPLFHSIDVGLICKDCLEQDKKQCPHNKGRLPAWKSGGRMNRMKAIMKNDMEAFARENLGAMISTSDYVFDRPGILRFENRDAYFLFNSQPFVHVAIDPAGGGTLSDYTIMSMVKTRDGKNVIVGMDTSASKKQTEIDNLVRGHFAGLRRHPCLQESMIIVYVEANMSWLIPSNIKNIVTTGVFGHVIMETSNIKSTDENLPGVLTTNANKRLYAEILQSCIIEDSLSFSSHCSKHAQFHSNKRKLMDQLRNYRREIKEPNDMAFGQFRESYTGKAKGQKDDMCLCIQLLLYWRAQKIASQQFRQFCYQNNIQIGN